ncbi:hypothetical protein ZIOFF_047504 [Zingiber officinale]|uniref:Uncharacterized protein n=1 Tax=Zingiber officinale TaxID=94328 RepID=A0A8J5KKG5_ZINOF|nr:hypothetical protein ZIOFF_047504 [Zingiber officinale]
MSNRRHHLICKELTGARSPAMAKQPVADEWLAIPVVVSVLSAVLLRLPSISVRHYLVRIFRYTCCNPSCYVVSYIYLDSFAGSRRAVALDSFNVHHLLITSVLTAIKFMDDMYVSKCHPPQETE